MGSRDKLAKDGRVAKMTYFAQKLFSNNAIRHDCTLRKVLSFFFSPTNGICYLSLKK